MAPGLLRQNSLFGGVFFVSKSLLGIERRREIKKKIAILTRKPPIDVGMLISRTWPRNMHLTQGRLSLSHLQNPDCLIQISGSPAIVQGYIIQLPLLLLF